MLCVVANGWIIRKANYSAPLGVSAHSVGQALDVFGSKIAARFIHASQYQPSTFLAIQNSVVIASAVIIASIGFLFLRLPKYPLVLAAVLVVRWLALDAVACNVVGGHAITPKE